MNPIVEATIFILAWAIVATPFFFAVIRILRELRNDEQATIESSGGNVFADLGLPDAEKRLADAEIKFKGGE